jgi:hypothetical protein
MYEEWWWPEIHQLEFWTLVKFTNIGGKLQPAENSRKMLDWVILRSFCNIVVKWLDRLLHNSLWSHVRIICRFVWACAEKSVVVTALHELSCQLQVSARKPTEATNYIFTRPTDFTHELVTSPDWHWHWHWHWSHWTHWVCTQLWSRTIISLTFSPDKANNLVTSFLSHSLLTHCKLLSNSIDRTHIHIST